MALMPGAVIKLIPRHNTGKRRPTGRGTSFHVTASGARSMFGYFSTVADCSHFHVAKDGTIEQYIDTAFYGRAQVEGNDMVSVETQGAAPGVNAETEPWTDAQVRANARIARWVHDTEGAPLVLMPDSRPSSRGVGCHRLGIAPWRVKGGQVWSSKNGKVCPGSAKVRQLPDVVALAKGSPALGSPVTTLPGTSAGEPSTEEIDMTALYDTKGNDGRNLFDSVIQTRNELPDRAAEGAQRALFDTRVQGRNVFDWAIQDAADDAAREAREAARDAVLLATVQAVAAGGGVDPEVIAAAAKAGADRSLADADFPTAAQIGQAVLDAQERAELARLRARVAELEAAVPVAG